MPANLQTAISSLVALLLSAWAVKFGLEAKDTQGCILAISLAAGALAQAAYGWAMSRMTSKLELAEARVPGITKKTGPEATETIIHNDPNSPDPPTIVTPQNQNQTPPTP